ncbi:MAG: hypothetical protein QXI36_02065 [Candidatus Bathyarchaeia archaeon]
MCLEIIHKLKELLEKTLQLQTVVYAHGERHEPGGGDPISGIPPALHEQTHRDGGSDPISGPLKLDAIPNIDWARISANFPRTIAELLSNHTKTVHDALGIDADTVDTFHANALEKIANKGVASGYCELDASALIPITRVPTIPYSKTDFANQNLLTSSTPTFADLSITNLNYIEKGKHIPIAVRMQENSFVYVDSPYLVCRGKSRPLLTAGGYYVEPREDTYEHCSWITLKEYGYGTYQWIAKVGGTTWGEEYACGFEHHHGFPLEGLITFLRLYDAGGLKHRCWTSWNGNQQTTDLTEENWTTERTFKIEWTSTYVKFYINNVLKATHSTVVPQDSMGFFSEACAYRGGTTESVAYYKLNTFEKIA